MRATFASHESLIGEYLAVQIGRMGYENVVTGLIRQLCPFF